MYTSIKLNDYNVFFCPFNIISRVNNYIRERERERQRERDREREIRFLITLH